MDHNKRNNAVSNLEWVRYAENQRRARKDFISPNEAGALEAVKITIYEREKALKTISSFEDMNEEFWKIIGLGSKMRNGMSKDKVKDIFKRLINGNFPSGEKKYCGLIFKVERN